MQPFLVLLLISIVVVADSKSTGDPKAQIKSAIAQLKSEHVKMVSTGIYHDLKLVEGLKRVIDVFKLNIKQLPERDQPKFNKLFKEIETRCATMKLRDHFDSTIFQKFDAFFRALD